MAKYRAIAIGASAGGVETLRTLVHSLPSSLAGPVFVTLHVPPHSRSLLPQLLDKAGPMSAIHPADGDAVAPSTIYVAPPNRHLIVRDGKIHLSAGAKENGSRPAIDPMFRSASRVYGPDLVGVVLSGTLDDGASGLAYIKSRGGATVVQSPDTAIFPDMPRNAIAATPVDHVVPPEVMGALLSAMVGMSSRRGRIQEAGMSGETPSNRPTPATAGHPDAREPGADGTPSAFTCPDCGGVLDLVIRNDGQLSFNCQVGHPWSPHALLAQQLEMVEESLWAALRILVEHKRLNERMLATARIRNLTGFAEMYERRLKEAEHHEARIREVIRLPLPSYEPPSGYESPAAAPESGEGVGPTRAGSGGDEAD